MERDPLFTLSVAHSNEEYPLRKHRVRKVLEAFQKSKSFSAIHVTISIQLHAGEREISFEGWGGFLIAVKLNGLNLRFKSNFKLSQEESLTQFRTLLPCYVIYIVYSSHPTPNSVKHPGPSTTCVTTLQLARFINRPKVNLDTRQSQGAPGSMKPELNP